MTLIRHPQIECEGPDCRVRVEVPSECEAEQEAFLPPGWMRLSYGPDSEGRPVTDDKDYHCEACLFAALARAHGSGAVALELDLLRKEKGELDSYHDSVYAPPIGSEAQRKMDERSRAAGIDHQFNGDPEDPLICSVCGTEHMG